MTAIKLQRLKPHRSTQSTSPIDGPGIIEAGRDKDAYGGAQFATNYFKNCHIKQNSINKSKTLCWLALTLILSDSQSVLQMAMAQVPGGGSSTGSELEIGKFDSRCIFMIFIMNNGLIFHLLENIAHGHFLINTNNLPKMISMHYKMDGSVLTSVLHVKHHKAPETIRFESRLGRSEWPALDLQVH